MLNITPNPIPRQQNTKSKEPNYQNVLSNFVTSRFCQMMFEGAGAFFALSLYCPSSLFS